MLVIVVLASFSTGITVHIIHSKAVKCPSACLPRGRGLGTRSVGVFVVLVKAFPMFQLLRRQLRLAGGGKLFQQTHSIVLALAAIATFDKSTLARAMEGRGSAHAQYRLFSSEDEVGKAHAAAAGVGNSSVPPQPTVFTKILNKEIPADIVYEDDKVYLPTHHPRLPLVRVWAVKLPSPQVYHLP